MRTAKAYFPLAFGNKEALSSGLEALTILNLCNKFYSTFSNNTWKLHSELPRPTRSPSAVVLNNVLYNIGISLFEKGVNLEYSTAQTGFVLAL